MSDEIGSLAVKIALDSSSFTQGMRNTKRELSLLGSEFKANTSLLGDNSKGIEGLRLKSEMLSKSIDIQKGIVGKYQTQLDKSKSSLEQNATKMMDLKSKVESAKSAWQESEKVIGKNADATVKLKTNYEALSKEYSSAENKVKNNAKTIEGYTIQLNNAKTALNKMGSELQDTNNKIDTQASKWTKAGESLDSIGNKMKTVGGGMKTVGKDLSLYVTAPLVAIGTKAISIGMDFESSMSKVKAVSGATGESFDQLKEQALELGSDTAFSANEAAMGMQNLASAGFNTVETMQAMPGLLDLAASGGLDVATASDIASSALRGFGIDASQSGHVADVLARAAADTNAEVTDMGASLKYAATPAHALGMSIEETSAAIGELANVGIKGESAGTVLRGSLISLASPSKEAADAMKELGFEAFDSQGKMLPFKDVINNLGQATKGLTDEKKADAIATIFGRESMSGMLALVDAGPESFGKLTESFRNSDGAAKDMATTMKDNTKGSIDEMMGSLETAAIKIETAAAPAIISLAKGAQELADKFSALSPETQENILKFGLVVAAAGPVALVLGNLITIGGTLVTVAGGISTALGLTATAAVGVEVASVGAATAVAGVGTAGVAAAAGTAGVGVAMGGVALAAAPFVLAGAAIAGVGYAVYKGMTDTATPSVELFGDAVKTTTESVKDSNGKLVESSVNTFVKISDSTQKSVGAYVKLDDDATKSLTNLFVNSTIITGQITTDMTTKFNTMGTAIKTGIDKSFADSYGTTQKFFADSKVLTETEEIKILADMTAKNEAKKVETDNYTKQIQEILRIASEANRALTLDEQTKINAIQNTMKTTAVKTMSDGEVESKAILERLKLVATQITTEQASTEIKNAVAAKDGSITAANEKYNQTVASIIRMRDETGVISADQATKLIADATRQKDESVTQAEALKTQVVEKITSMNSETAKSVDTNSGNILSAWDKLKNWWSSWWPEDKSPKVTANDFTGSSSIPTYKFQENWTGTDNFSGGLTTMHEKGYEVYNLPAQSQILNHEASLDLVTKTAESVANKVALSMMNSNSGGSGKNISIEVPVIFDSREVARVLAPYNDIIQGSNVALAGRGVGV